MSIYFHQSTAGGLGAIPPDTDFLVLLITREEVEAGHVGRCVSDLLTLSTDQALVARFVHGVSFSVLGYEDDPRHLYAVPEFKVFLQALNQQWPYWIHFLTPEPDMWRVVLLSLLPDAKSVDLGDGRKVLEYDRYAFKLTLDHLVNAVNNLHLHMRLDVKARATIVDATFKVIQATF